LTTVVYSQTDEEQVVKMINDSIKVNPRNSNWLFLKGMMFTQSNKFQSAIEPLSMSLKYLQQFKIDNPNAIPVPNDQPLDSCDILQLRAFCYDNLDSLQSSIADYRYLQSRKPNDFFYSVAVARIYIKRKDFRNAQYEIDQLKKFSENERGMVYQAILFYEQGMYLEALNSIDIALKKYPDSIEGLVTKAKILGKLDKPEEACKNAGEAKTKITLDYFGGQHGFLREFNNDISHLTSLYCK
jgi:tetratricopeptide (TPR) repeat protein